jgi:hypothetical protein
MNDRLHVLSKPAWRGLAGHPDLEGLDVELLRALDSFFDHMATHQISTVDTADFLAWADLSQGTAGLEALKHGLAALDPDDPSLPALSEALVLAQRKASHKPVYGVRPSYARSVSVPVSELPASWQAFLEGIRIRRAGGDPSAPATAIQDRMSQKLGQYILSVRTAGLEEDLHLEGLQGFYRDLTSRGSSRTGEPLRPAALRATFEELERFARLRGCYPEALQAALKTTLKALRDQEARTSQLKYGKMHGIGGPPEIISRAFEALAVAAKAKSPATRHKRRNRAAALGLPAILPLRRDWDRIVFGKTLVWSGDRYRFRNFRPKKTALLDGRRDFPASIHPAMTPFVDALILQDNAPRYLDALREQAERVERPLFVHPDGTPCAKSYVSRVWSEVVGTGATIARSLVHDFFGAKGEDGVRKALLLCDQYAFETTRHYVGVSVHQRLFDAAQDDVLETFEGLLDDG